MAGASVQGINWVAFGVTDDHGGILTTDTNGGVGNKGVLIVDGDAGGATTANITGLEEKGTAQYANNKVKRMAHGAQTPTVALTMLDMDYKALMKMKGYDDDGKGGFVLNTSRKPHVALMICSSDFNGDYVFDCFANGEMIEAAHNHVTNNKNETDYSSTLEYDAIDPINNNIFLDNKEIQTAYKQYFEAGKNFDWVSMFKEVFGCYVLDDENIAIIGAKAKGSITKPNQQPAANTNTEG